MRERIKQWDVVICDFGPQIGSVQGGVRPALVVSNNFANNSSTTITVVPFTTRRKRYLPVHVLFMGLSFLRNSVLLVEQIKTVDEKCINKIIGNLDGYEELKRKVYNALDIQFGRKESNLFKFSNLIYLEDFCFWNDRGYEFEINDGRITEYYAL